MTGLDALLLTLTEPLPLLLTPLISVVLCLKALAGLALPPRMLPVGLLVVFIGITS